MKNGTRDILKYTGRLLDRVRRRIDDRLTQSQVIMRWKEWTTITRQRSVVRLCDVMK